MLQVHDIRESRVYQEGKEVGLALAIARMAANKIPIEQIAAILELDVERVRQVLAAAGQN